MNIIFALLAGFVFGFLYRNALKLIKRKVVLKRAKNNIGQNDRILRFVFAVALTWYGHTFSSNAALFFAGFCYFEAMFSWCGFYAILGHNTCEIN